MLRNFSYVALGLLTLACSGCGVRPVQGGMKGTLKVDQENLGEIQLTVHRVEGTSFESVGFGVTNNEGAFELLKPGAKGALWLTPGEYRITLESIGPPIQFPKEYTQADTTPLKVSWPANGRVLELDATSVKHR